jgi:ribosomal protein S18 acetylase RimI-like enzyme
MRKYTYFKRYRMELDLRRPPIALADVLDPSVGAAALPAGYQWLPWRDSLCLAHAEVKALCFQEETDAVIFRCLASVGGCRELMMAIRDRPGFCARATWLVAASNLSSEDAATGIAGNCVATVQGVIDSAGHGGIQNVGVIPEFRGRGLGRALMVKALAGFLQSGAKRAYLEVTAGNQSAIRIYRELGFRCTRTVYRAVPALEPVAAGV